MLSITSIDDMIRCIEDLRLESRSMMLAELDHALHLALIEARYQKRQRTGLATASGSSAVASVPAAVRRYRR
ncbi:hypothetical protein [Methylobacterium isbiliense]|jgi:hypothetical protein|uniref:Uncharacterized protein n=1 Tax=Methylobacterium isbiliense TaxID=315478 RepID=A0ABQ4SCG0_9HYPH|nr:hypothetical protein [Methylobacterium isbiliense]MDN3621994.1 hypothetical protein [Methylobacterium isbiliense]GJD99492.1 hypothetical protein GMJLKIPL_1410 [Methylobacterium isbiliense]